MATPTRVRQLIGGVWRYVTADEDAGGGSLPDGGTTGQVLAKASDADQDAGWTTSTPFNGGTVTTPLIVKSNDSEPFSVRLGNNTGLLVVTNLGETSINGQDTSSGPTLGIVPPSDAAEYVKTLQTLKPDQSSQAFTVYANGQIGIQGNAALDDGNLGGSQLVIWWDATAGKVKFQATKADSSVVHGEIQLT